MAALHTPNNFPLIQLATLKFDPQQWLTQEFEQIIKKNRSSLAQIILEVSASTPLKGLVENSSFYSGAQPLNPMGICTPLSPFGVIYYRSRHEQYNQQSKGASKLSHGACAPHNLLWSNLAQGYVRVHLKQHNY